MEINISAVSSILGESQLGSEISETFSADKQIVFADEANYIGASSTLTTVLSVFAGVGSPLVVGHLW